MARRPTTKRLVTLLVAFLTVFFFIPRLLGVCIFCSSSSSSPSIPLDLDERDEDITAPCVGMKGAEDLLVIMKTGATESLKKVPVHFDTTLRCIPHYVIYSDLEEEIQGHKIFDSLDEVDDNIKQSYPGFDMYNRMKLQGRDGLKAEEYTEGKGGAAWNLDKWKFLPIVDKALKLRPYAKWFIFIEADTYTFWPNMLRWLKGMDPKKPIYIGNQMQIDPQIFAHGGAGFIMSVGAMKEAVDQRNKNLKMYDDFTAHHWAGDCVLGKMMQDRGVPLTWAWPLLQEHNAFQLDPDQRGWDKRLWCWPVVTYHHVTPDDVQGFNKFEQEWVRKTKRSIRYGDLFLNHIRPMFQTTMDNWDNMSQDIEYTKELFASNPELQSTLPAAEQAAPESFENCRAVCTKHSDCLQFLHSPDRCMIGKTIRLGQGNATFPGGIKSGFMLDRIDEVIKKIETCKEGGWIMPPNDPTREIGPNE